MTSFLDTDFDGEEVWTRASPAGSVVVSFAA